MKSLPKGSLVVLGGAGLVQRTSDTTFPFVQQSSFWYLTGIEEPNIVLAMSEHDEYCIVPPTNDMLAVFDGAPITETLQATSGVMSILPHEDGWKKLERDCKNAKMVYVQSVPPAYDEHHGLYTNPAPRSVIEKIQKLTHASKIDNTTLTSTIAYNRSIKQPVEIAAIEKAIEITKKGLHIVTSNYGSYAYEYEIEAELSKQFRLGGGNGHAFSPIVANGSHATTLHYVANNGSLTHELPTVIDVGADYSHYAADITRTILPSTPTTRQQEVYDAVKRVQQHALTLLKPGVTMHEYEQDVEKAMAKELVQLGLIKNAADRHAIRTYFPHASSHFLGLDVHDAGLYDKPLEADMVVTCEPGIYIAEEQFGVRIEDDVLITESGNKVLSA